MDIVDPTVRSRMMSGIRGRDTAPELAVRRFLHAAGLRYRLHVRQLPGTPDLVFARHRAVVFVNGCFWHAHEGCSYFRLPATRTTFWRDKLAANVARDKRVESELEDDGWRVAIVWECAVRQHLDLTALEAWIRSHTGARFTLSALGEAPLST